jgi:hypothetical protein
MEHTTSKRRRKRMSWKDGLASYVTALTANNESGVDMPKASKRWAENQRYSYSLGNLSEEKIQLLNDINFNWRLRNSCIINNNKAVAYCTSQNDSTPRDCDIEKWMSNTLNKLKKKKKTILDQNGVFVGIKQTIVCRWSGKETKNQIGIRYTSNKGRDK